jgi:nucleoside 2-deoxyribosyltransferase
MKYYISGKIGKENPNRETIAKFKKAEDMLKASGHDVFNPANSGLGPHAESLAHASVHKTSFYQEILLLDIQQLVRCDAVLVLPDWQQSPGAKAEIMLAAALGIPMFTEDTNGILVKMKFDVKREIEQ